MLLAFSSSWYLRKAPRQAFSLVSSYLNKTRASIVRDDDPKPPCCCLITRKFSSFPARSSSTGSSSSISPWLMVTPHIVLSSSTDTTVFKFYSLAEGKVISVDRKNLKVQLGLESGERVLLECRGSSHGWLALFDRSSSDLFLYNPLSNRHLKLPSLRKLEAETGDGCVHKLIISSSDPEGDVNCRAVMIHGYRHNLAFCCPNSSSEWFGTYRHGYHDVACCGDNLFLCINDEKRPIYGGGAQWPYPEFEGWDLKDVSRPMLLSLEDRLVKDFGKTFPWKGYRPNKDWFNREADFLVAAADDDMYYVCLNEGSLDSTEEGDCHFHVHKFDFENRKLVHMDGSLDGLALFVGTNHSFALSAAESSFPEPNSIYLTRQESYGDQPLGRSYIKAYNYQDRTFSPAPCYTYNKKIKIFKFYPTPPVWYTPTCAADIGVSYPS